MKRLLLVTLFVFIGSLCKAQLQLPSMQRMVIRNMTCLSATGILIMTLSVENVNGRFRIGSVMNN